MKKSLLALLLLSICFFSNAQQRDLWFNEMFTTPVKSNSEYIEMYNTSNSDIFLDCYIIVSYYPGGAYVYNFPTNAKIAALSYYLLASNSQIKFKGGNKNITPSDPTKFSDWSQTITGGYITKYTYNGTAWTNAGTPNAAEKQNFMPGDGALLLYKINSDGSTSIVNGIFGGNLPSAVTALNDLTNVPSSSSCYSGNVTLKFKNQGIGANTVDIAAVAASTGQDHGYAKIGNGTCGSWAKTQTDDEYTPGEKNPTSIGTVSSSLTTTQKLLCGNQINFSITSPASGSQYPVTVLLYIDENKDGILDGSTDTYVTTYPNLINSGSPTFYSFTSLASLPASKQYLVVYKTALGCFDQVNAPAVASGTITSIQKNVCGKKVDYTINANGDAITYSLPITVNLYYDEDGDGQLDADLTGKLLGSSTINSFNNGSGGGSFSLQTADQGKDVVIQYLTSSTCYTLPSAVPAALTGGLTTTQSYFCGKQVDYTINANGDAITYSLPITINLYFDEDGDGQLDADLTGKLLGTAQVSSLTSGATNGSIPLVDADMGKKIVVQYITSASCINAPSMSPTIAACVPTANNDYFTADQHPPHTIKGNLYGGNIKWSGELSATTQEYDSKSSNMAPAVQSGLDSDPGNPSLSKIVYELVSGPVYSTSCTGVGNVLFAFYSNGTFSIDRSDNICVSQVNFTYRIRNTITNAVSQTATVTVDFSENIVLPVTYTSFNAVRRNKNVELKWETASEENNKGFYVQRNTGGEWKNVAFVFSAAANGNSNTNLSYAYNDPNSLKGVSQYRILQVDIDGKGKYSEIRSVRGEEQAAKVVVFPNPSADKLNVLFEDAVSVRDIKVMDIAGRMVRQYLSVTSNSITIDNLKDGFYNIQVTDRHTGVSTVEKAVVKKR